MLNFISGAPNGETFMKKFPIQTINLSDISKVDSLVEHRRVFTMKDCELNIFETWRKCDNVALSYDGLVITSMMRGKKVMYLSGGSGFDFLPGETVILPEGVSMKVDFPEADEKHPVQCATLALNWDMVYNTMDFLNENYPKEIPWELNFSYFHFHNNLELANSLNKLISVSMEEDGIKDALVDLTLKTLLVRVVQTQQLSLLENNATAGHRFAPVVQYIREHLSRPISIESLCKIACMSKSVFFRLFRETFGISPVEYITKERIRLAKQLLADPTLNITEACYQAGFNNLNYFTRQFRKIEGVPPRVFRQH